MTYTIDNYHLDENISFKLIDSCYISDFIRRNEIWEPHLHTVFEKYISKDDVVLEAGCHIGTHSIKLSKLSKSLHCFEPLRSSAKLLQENLNLNNCNNAVVSNLGVSDAKGATKFSWVGNGNPGASGLKDNPMGEFGSGVSKEYDYEVELINIDSLDLPKLDFIKLDVEGYEVKAIQGGLNTIKKYKPIITLECWADHKGNASLEHTTQQFEFLLELGYELNRISHCDWLFLPI
jgi:FkbM family methyltransferase